MLDYVAVSKEWIFSGVGFSVVVAIIFVVRSILNRHRSDGSISTRPFPAETVRDMRRILPLLSFGHVIYALLIAVDLSGFCSVFTVHSPPTRSNCQASSGCRSL